MTNLILTALDKALSQDTHHISIYLGSLSQWVKHIHIIEYNEETIKYLFKTRSNKTKVVKLVERISYIDDILHVEYTCGIYGEKEGMIASFNQIYNNKTLQESKSKLSSSEELDEDAEEDMGQTS